MLVGPPLTPLAPDFPRVPRLAGGLIPTAINLWMGCSRAGTSSGLHHDYHDNLYVVLRGRKRFRLWPPSATPRMHPHGRLRKLHPNGRIVYEGQVGG